MRKRILITGVCGFIGKALWEFLHQKKFKYDIFGTDISKPSLEDQRRIFICDLNDPARLSVLLNDVQPNYIFHLAGGRLKTPEELLKANFRATQAFFEVLKNRPFKRIRVVIPGTAAEYGRAAKGLTRISEKVFPKPTSWYGMAKFMQTQLGLMYARQGFHVVIARIFNICGRGTPSGLALGHFAQQIAHIEKGLRAPVLHTQGLAGQRDCLDIEDVCDGLLALARNGKRGEVYNICSGKSYRMKDMLKILLSHSSVPSIEVKTIKQGPMESHNAVGSNTKIKEISNWRPQVSITQSLKNTLDYYRAIPVPIESV